MIPLYPLRFRPILRRYLWGGRRLATLLGKPLGTGSDYAESWEIVDRGQDQSEVQYGPLAGVPLSSLVRQRGDELLGKHHPRERFPLLLKFLDAHQTLSVQVHPDDAQAARRSPPDAGKTEAWVVLAAEPGSLIYAGLQPGVGRPALEKALRDGACEELLHRFEPAVGDCVFIPAGTVHAIGAGLVVAEIQQPSDTTFRLFDWNRVGTDGRPRPLHIGEALEVIDFERGPIGPQPPRPTDAEGQELLVDCDHFVLRRRRLTQPHSLGASDRCHVITVLDGSARMAGDPSAELLTAGSTVLLPASTGPVQLVPESDTVLLDSHLP